MNCSLVAYCPNNPQKYRFSSYTDAALMEHGGQESISDGFSTNPQLRPVLDHKVAHENIFSQFRLKRDVTINKSHVKIPWKKRHEGHFWIITKGNRDMVGLYYLYLHLLKTTTTTTQNKNHTQNKTPNNHTQNKSPNNQQIHQTPHQTKSNQTPQLFDLLFTISSKTGKTCIRNKKDSLLLQLLKSMEYLLYACSCYLCVV